MGTEVKKRALGLDYGSKTVGVAVSDGLGITAQGVEIIRRTQENKLRKTLARIEELIAEYDVGILVLGYPKNMNNTVGDRAEKSLEFQKMLEKRIEDLRCRTEKLLDKIRRIDGGLNRRISKNR